MKIIPVIMSGGKSARLWPLFHAAHPKPFIKLSDGKSLLQHTFLRASSLPHLEHILIMTHQDLFFKTENECRDINPSNSACTYLLEPIGRDTAAATAIAALYVQQLYGNDAMIMLFPADHAIRNLDAFYTATKEAIDLASQGRLVMFGINPKYPETGYGYIEAHGQNIIRFVEKPDLVQAKDYMTLEQFYWNSGMLCVSAGLIIKLMERYCPDILNPCRQALEAADQSDVVSGTQMTFDREIFAQIPKNSIDYALLEKAENMAIVRCDMEWSDIGCWNGFSELIEPDMAGNRTMGNSILIETKQCFIQNNDRLIGTLGVQDLIIVDSEEALLVAHKDHAQSVKHLSTQIKEKDSVARRLHRTLYRPWGSYMILNEGQKFKIKRIEVTPGAALSLQMHRHRSEHWIVISGTAHMIKGEQELILEATESIDIPCGHKHRLSNFGNVPLVIIEVQKGDYLGEDDIVRFEDIYGRQ